jgi:hypothetical protein
MNTSILFKKSFQHAALVSAVAALAAFGASNSFAASTSANSTATVIEPMEITKTNDLVFGQFARGAGGEVTVSTSNARTTDNTILSASGAIPKAAVFTVAGADDAGFSVGITNTPLTDGDGVETMALSTFSDIDAGDKVDGGDVTAGTLSETGELTIYLGGTLTVASDQTAGVYTGTVTTTVQYN